MIPLYDKDLTPMETRSPSLPRPARYPAPGGQFPACLRLDGYSLSLAADLPALEACLGLERASGAVLASEGVLSPQAVPYCEFLMLRNPRGALAALCRLMRLDGSNPIPNPLATGRFQLSPLLTALRYSREGILEMGAPVFAPGTAPQAAMRAARLLWTGMTLYLERNGLGFVIGREALPVPAVPARPPVTTALAALAPASPPTFPADPVSSAAPSGRADPTIPWRIMMAEHGLPPDLETEARPGFRAREDGVDGACLDANAYGREPLRFWPAGLQEALLRGCRLACEPAFDPRDGRLEFVWVASRDMLDDKGDRPCP
jgi:hypothetical protein